MPRPDPKKVHDVALHMLEKHGDRALELARELEKISSRPTFAAAVTAEIERLVALTRH